jgi:recombination associated protein RdgC
MWFKNLSLFRFSEPFTWSLNEFEQRLERGQFHPCGALEPMSYGWVSPMGKSGTVLTHVANDCWLICAQKEEKILPNSVIQELVEERVAQAEELRGGVVGKREKDSLRDVVISELLPKAFSHSRKLYACIDGRGGWLLVDSASSKKAEELVSYLRRSLDSLPVKAPVTKNRPSAIMTDWLAGKSVPVDLQIEDECELRSREQEGGIVRCLRQDLAAPEIQNHLQAGKEVAKLALCWDERLSFVLDDTLGVKRLRFLDMVQEQVAEAEARNEAEQMDVDFIIQIAELSKFLPRLMDFFGGENHAGNSASSP